MRKVFFSFYYQRDSWRVSQVRNSNIIKRKYDKNTFLDSSDWESVKKGGEQAIKNWINRQLKGTSVTIVLIGNETALRKFVNYEIEQSYEKGKGLLGIHISGIRNRFGQTDFRGNNPLDNWYVKKNNRKVFFSDIFKTYDWVYNDGRNNIDDWIEEAAQIAKR